MDRLTEIRTRVECYQSFLEDLEEITDALGGNTGLGMYIAGLRDEYQMELFALDSRYRNIEHYRHEINRGDYRGVFLELLLMFAKTHAKMGEIAFLLDNSIEHLEDVEDKILADMEQSANRRED